MVLFFNILHVIVSCLNLIFAIFMLLIIVKQRDALQAFFETVFQKNQASKPVARKSNDPESSGLTDL